LVRETTNLMLRVTFASTVLVMTPHRLPEQRVLPIDGDDGRRRRDSIDAAAIDVDDHLQLVKISLGSENHCASFFVLRSSILLHALFVYM
jgi:hypothetical protein